MSIAGSERVVVMKFGGTSVGSAERMGNAAKRVVRRMKTTGDKVVVVVSAMSGETDRLIELYRKVAGSVPPDREYHQLLAAGEQVSGALTAAAFEREGVPARSLTAFQVPIRTEEAYGQHLISQIDTRNIEEMLRQGIVPVIAGFQGVDHNNGYTTLGRGGSDTTAVAVAAALHSCRCEILTDIDGVYTALPTICKKARKLSRVTYEEMLELASSGAKVLQARSVSLAHKYRVPLVVLTSFSEVEGTEIVEGYKGMEDAVVSGITCRTDQVKLTLRNLPDKPGIAARVFRILAEAEVVVDMIVQSDGAAGRASISLTVPQESGQIAYDALMKLVGDELEQGALELDKSVAKLSVVGEGMRTHAGIAARTFEVLGREGINVEMITTSEIKISVAIDAKYAELAVRVLHEEFIEREGQPAVLA